MVYNFDNSKKMALGKRDKSDIGWWDKKIKILCDKINKEKDYFTTSSCSGRIVLISDEEKKRKGLILFRAHDEISFKRLESELGELECAKGLIFFKQEPCVLVVSCRNKEKQWKLFNLARNNGWKKSGILSLDKKLLIELISTENISFPILKNGKLLVDKEFLELVIKKANFNLERSWKKIRKLMVLVQRL